MTKVTSRAVAAMTRKSTIFTQSSTPKRVPKRLCQESIRSSVRIVPVTAIDTIPAQPRRNSPRGSPFAA